MKLHTILPSSGLTRKKKKRLGRGDSSGKGNYCGRGIKGAKSRSGSSHLLGFEGGQTPIYRRLPKRGFRPLEKDRYQEVNLEKLNRFKDAEIITPQIMHNEGLIKNLFKKVKILGEGEVKVKLTIEAHRFSKKAKEKIEKMGGEVKEIRMKKK